MSRKIMITNDDGITADGIIRLAKAAVKFGEVWVVAPAEQKSAASHSITLRTAIDVHPYDFPVEGVKAYAVDGTPADCVRVGVLNLVPGKPDVVLSGINFGYNTATDLQYSATVGAAFEARFQEVQAIAFSEGTQNSSEITDAYLEQILEELLPRELGYGEIWNVNFPSCGLANVKGILRDRTVSRKALFKDRYDEESLADGGIRFRVNGQMKFDAEEGSDLRALLDDYIAIGIAKNLC